MTSSDGQFPIALGRQAASCNFKMHSNRTTTMETTATTTTTRRRDVEIKSTGLEKRPAGDQLASWADRQVCRPGGADQTETGLAWPDHLTNCGEMPGTNPG